MTAFPLRRGIGRGILPIDGWKYTLPTDYLIENEIQTWVFCIGLTIQLKNTILNLISPKQSSKGQKGYPCPPCIFIWCFICQSAAFAKNLYLKLLDLNLEDIFVSQNAVYSLARIR